MPSRQPEGAVTHKSAVGAQSPTAAEASTYIYRPRWNLRFLLRGCRASTITRIKLVTAVKVFVRLRSFQNSRGWEKQKGAGKAGFVVLSKTPCGFGPQGGL